LDYEGTKAQFEKLTAEINEFFKNTEGYDQQQVLQLKRFFTNEQSYH
jgi:hypothetical protein